MLKNLFFSIIIASIALLSFGCFSTPPGKITYDPDLPPEQTTYVVFQDTMQIHQYNGIDVWDSWHPKGSIRENRVTLPAGPTTILFDLSAYITVGRMTTHFTAQDIELRFDFEAGKEYTVALYTESMGAETFFLGKKKIGLAVWDFTRGKFVKDTAIKTWEFGET